MATERRRTRERRNISTARPRNYSDLYKGDNSGAQAGASTSAAAATAVRESSAPDWQEEYAYIIGDLKRLLVISTILLTAIIVAGIFL